MKVLGVDDVGARFPHRVTYHASCHAARLLGAKEEPLALLSKVDGLELVPLVRCEDCCGFGGTFSVKLASISAAMVDEKVDHVLRTEAEYLVGTDMGCLMNIAGRLERRGAKSRSCTSRRCSAPRSAERARDHERSLCARRRRSRTISCAGRCASRSSGCAPERTRALARSAAGRSIANKAGACDST